MAARPTSHSNRLVQSLSDKDYRRLSPMLETVTLNLGDVLCEAGDSMARFSGCGRVSCYSSANKVSLKGFSRREGMFGPLWHSV